MRTPTQQQGRRATLKPDVSVSVKISSLLCTRIKIPSLPLVERDSPRDQLVVTIFLLTVFGLLLGAGIKARMVKAGLDTSLPWAAGRRWWEVCITSLLLHCLAGLTVCWKAWVPQRQPEDIRLELSNRVRELWNRNRQNVRRQEYTTVSDNPDY